MLGRAGQHPLVVVAALVALGCGCVDDGGGTPPSLPDTGQAEDAADGGALAPDAVADPGGGIPADAPRPDPGPPDPGRKAELGFEIGQSCRGNEDCPGGWCVELEEGASVCTLSCFQECPTGWTCRQVGGLGPDAAFVCVPLPSDVCAQCSSSEGCGVLGLCAESPEGGGRCLLACGVTGGHCSSGFACAERAEEPSGDTVEVCAPVGT